METSEWYRMLAKPDWAPPPWLFAPVWTVLYAIIAVTYGYVGYLFIHKRVLFAVVLPFILNLVFNFAFTPLQFGLRSNLLAAIDILFVLATIVGMMVAIYPHAKWVALANIPYLLWVSFATVLQVTITALNWK